jgi:hypothetical protein
LAIHGEIEGGAVRETGIVDGLKSEEDVIGREGVTVGPENARAQVKGEGAIIGGNVPARGESGFDFLGDGVVVDEGVEKESDEAA